MTVIALGLNHTTAPLDVRGRFAFPAERLVPTLRAFRSRVQRDAEVAIVSTCNRTELYLGSAGDDRAELADAALGWLAESGGMAANELQATSTSSKTVAPHATPSASRAGCRRWSSARRRSSAR